ncbi:MAG TPA: SpoIID/LytB domain-containing protein [Chroococcales cyanobacterium]
MFRLPEKHPIFNRAVLWPIGLFSVALLLPLALAESMPPQSQTETSSSKPSPQLEPSPQQSSTQSLAEQEWHKNIASQSLSWQQNPPTTASQTAPASPVPKTNPPQPQSSVSKTQTSPSKSSESKTSTAKSETPKAQTQTSKPSQTSKQQKSKTHRSARGKAQTPPSARHTPVIELRVAISNGESSLAVGTSTPGEVLDARGKSLGKLSANDATYALPDGPNIRLGKWQTPAGVWIKPTNGGYVFVGDRWFRGDLLLVSQGNTLLAVNYVDLEAYLVSVVGAEVSPSWPMDALKAQAIAARSYALVHYLRPASKLYDLGNTQRWQVYRGMKDEWNTTRQAVQETHGLFLSYKGGVVESMYAASDDIVSNVFGGRGMSQNGALSLAQQGYNYQQILGNYYPGTGLSWIDTKQSDTD